MAYMTMAYCVALMQRLLRDLSQINIQGNTDMFDTEKLLIDLLEQTGQWLPKLGAALIVLVVFYILNRVIQHLINKNSTHIRLDKHLIIFIQRVIRITLVTIALITAFGTLGVDVSALVAGLGLTGFALGFALKDTISNLLSGVLILLYRPFEIDSRIEVAGHSGKVISIDLRYTELESDGQRVLIPNSKLFTDPIKVFEADVASEK